MSLDVYLLAKKKFKKPQSSGIFIREHGKMVEISQKEWDEKHPDKTPVRLKNPPTETNELYWSNITHNLNKMADKAGIYEALWRPEEKGYKVAKDIIEIVEAGLKELKKRSEYFKGFNPENGWGTYEQLVNFTEEYLEACKKYPEAIIRVSI